MKDIWHYKNYYFLGIGGIGMSALARYFARAGRAVAGYDRTLTALTAQLEQEGISVSTEAGVAAMPAWVNPADTLIILTPAVPKDHAQLVHVQQQGFDLMKRAAVLGAISRAHPTLAVAGTHGKTTTSTMLAHLLKHAGLDITAFLGGIATNYHSNLLLSQHLTDSTPVVAEADEFDRSFLQLAPSLAIVTSADPDHLDIYGQAEHVREGFELFLQCIKPGGTAIIKAGLPLQPQLAEGVTVYHYGAEGTDSYGANPRFTGGRYVFDLHIKAAGSIEVALQMPGLHNMENASAAALAAHLQGLSLEQIKAGLESFKGVHRRFEYRVNGPRVYIDDYAHHPAELTAFLNSVKQMYPERKLLACFQPHLFSRTRDFMDGFAQALALADELVLLDIYPARELPIAGVTSQALLDQVPLEKKQLLSKSDFLNLVREVQPPLLVTVGAGDIDNLATDLQAIMAAGAE